MGQGQLHIPLPIVDPHQIQPDVSHVLQTLQKVLLGQLHGHLGRLLQGDDGRRVVGLGVARGGVGGPHDLFGQGDRQLDKLADLGRNGGRINGLCHIADAPVTPVHRHRSAHARLPPADPRPVVHDLRVGRGHQGNHGHGKQLVDKDLIGNQRRHRRLAVVAVGNPVPAHPGNGVPLLPGVPLLAHHRVLDGLDGPNGAALPVLPELHERCHLAVGHGVIAVVGLVAVAAHLLRVSPIALHLLAHVPHQLTPGDDDPRLILHLGAVGIPEDDPGVLQQLGADGALGRLPGLHLGVEPAVNAGVPVHGGVAHELPHTLAHLGLLVDGFKLGVDHAAKPLHVALAGLSRGGQGTCVDLQVVGGGGSN